MSSSDQERFVVGIFRDADGFVRALNALLEADFDRAEVSVLADHDTVGSHFGTIPSAESMSDRPDTPRVSLDDDGALRAAINFIAETVAIISEIGASGMAYAVGGPVGVASATAMSSELTVSELLSRTVKAGHLAQYEESIRDGGVICWVRVSSAESAASAERTLTSHGATGVHVVNLAT